MTAEELDDLLRQAGISLPQTELAACLQGAVWLLDLANHLPVAKGERDDD